MALAAWPGVLAHGLASQKSQGTESQTKLGGFADQLRMFQ